MLLQIHEFQCDHALARYQLAFALQLTGELPGLRGPVLAFDPAFSEVDRALLASLDVQVCTSALLQPDFPWAAEWRLLACLI